jgi:excisionase family DNA binding protein
MVGTVEGTEALNSAKGNKKKDGQRTSNPLPRLLTLKQASEYLGLTVWAIRERIWAGQLPVLQFPGGKKQYLDRSDLESFIERNKRIVA